VSTASILSKLKGLSEKLRAGRRERAEEMKAILTEREGESLLVSPLSMSTYKIVGNVPVLVSRGMGAGGVGLTIGDPISLGYEAVDPWGKRMTRVPIALYKEYEEEQFIKKIEEQETPSSPEVRFRMTGRQEYGLPGGGGQFVRGAANGGLIRGLGRLIRGKKKRKARGIGQGEPYVVWRLDNLITGYSFTPWFGIPYHAKTGGVKLAVAVNPHGSVKEFERLIDAKEVVAPYHGDIDPTDHGFDAAYRMGYVRV